MATATTAVVALLAILTLPLATAKKSTGDSKIKWQTHLNDALETAATQGKPVLLRFTASWCPPCLVMNASVWPNAAVSNAVNSGYLPVEIDIDAPGAAAIAEKFRIQGVPSIVLLDSKGQETARANFMSAKQVLRFLEQPAG
jgi:thiol:disulfide interchange protein DsbD